MFALQRSSLKMTCIVKAFSMDVIDTFFYGREESHASGASKDSPDLAFLAQDVGVEMLLLLAVGMVIGSARITRRRMLESLAATVAVPYLGAKERLDDAELIESRFAPLSCEIFAAAQKTRRHWSRILRPLSYEQYLQEYEQSQELRANIIKVLDTSVRFDVVDSKGLKARLTVRL